MATQALYLKWRPQTFDDMIGQEHITRALLGAIRLNRIRHAYLFSGPHGTGKTTTARLLAKAVNCLNPDVNLRPCDTCTSCQAIGTGRFLDIIEIDAASHTGVDDVRELREKIAFAPSEGRYKVYIIDEVHRFSGSAFDALLKTIEEPPEHAIFILATTEIHKVPDTIKSRCLTFEFRHVSLREVMGRLRLMCETEGISIDDAALELIARQGTGSVRDSISLLDQIVADPTIHISYELALDMLGAANNRYVWEVAQAIVDNHVAYGLDMINQAIDTGADPRQFARQMVEHLRLLLLTRLGSANLVDTSDEMRRMLTEQSAQFAHHQLLKAIRAFNSAVDDMRGGWQPQLPLELAVVESIMATSETAASPNPPASPRQPVEQPRRPSVPPAPATISAAPSVVIEQKLPTLMDIKHHWQDLLNLIGQQAKSMLSTLKQAQPLYIEGSILVIGVSTVAHKDTLNKSKQYEPLLNAIHQLFGEGVGVRVELMDEHSPIPSKLVENDPFFLEAMSLGAVISFEDPEE